MSTEGAVGFVQCDNATIIYNGCDSYPDGLGNDVLDFIRRWGLDKIEEMVSNFVYVNGNSEGADFYSLEDYFLNEDGKTNYIVDIHKKLSVCNDINFIFDSLFCEWLYLLDLDSENLEVFKGLNEDIPMGRFSCIPPSESGYRAVSLVKTIPFNNLPPKFHNGEFE